MHILARLIKSVFVYPELTFRLLTALATGFAVYFIQKLFRSESDWSAAYIIVNISFLYFAFHSPGGMLVLLWFSAFLGVLVGRAEHRLAVAGIIATMGLGVDSLVATALMTYVLARITTAKETPRWKATALASTALGAVVWVLLAYMLYGSSAFGVALGSGFQGLFRQINPIHFGASVIVTFNILLVWVFRTPAEKSDARYLGSLLIVLLLIVRTEPVYLVMLLMAGVWYLHKTSALPSRQWMLPAYALVNVAAFFLLPVITPLEATYNVRAERAGEAQMYLSGHFSKHLPSYQSLTHKAGMFAAAAKLRYEKPRVPVILGPSTETGFDPAALRGMASGRTIAGFDMTDRRFETVFGNDTSVFRIAQGWSFIRYIATEALPGPMDSLLKAHGELRSRESRLRIYTIDSMNYSRFFDSYIYHHYLSYH